MEKDDNDIKSGVFGAGSSRSYFGWRYLCRL